MKDIQKNTTETDYLVIPNPIYDVVFRYLMQDYDSAMIILSTLINEKIKSLELDKALSEITIKDPVTGKDVKLLHLDFSAVIEKENGEEEVVMIELQKVAVETDIFRFKQYIAENFQKKRKITKIDPDTAQEIEIELPYRLIPIFILNFKIEDEISDLMIKSRHIKTGIFTDKNIDKKNEFIDHLSYELYVVQLPYLQEVEDLDFKNDNYKHKLFALLKLFDQHARVKNNEYRLRLFRRIFPGFLDSVIKRLQTADIDNPNLEKQMKAEDHYLKPLLQRDNKISWLLLNKKQIEMDLEKKDKALVEKDKAIGEKDKALGEKDKVILELAKTLNEAGKSTKDIQTLTNLSQKVIDGL